jgi:hypothetical protein
MKRVLSVVALALFAASNAGAQTLLSDNFNGENAGNEALNYIGFANWNVTGQVDLVKTGGAFGITCITGSCVDLDGTSGPGTLTTKLSYSFSAGDVMRLSFDLSGSQRSQAADNVVISMSFAGATTVTSCAASSGFVCPFGIGLTTTSTSKNIAGTDPWTSVFYEFTAGSSGSVQYSVGTNSADNVGPIVDNMVITRTSTAVPEPSTWALMAAGLGALAVGSKRRTRRTTI